MIVLVFKNTVTKIGLLCWRDTTVMQCRNTENGFK